MPEAEIRKPRPPAMQSAPQFSPRQPGWARFTIAALVSWRQGRVTRQEAGAAFCGLFPEGRARVTSPAADSWLRPGASSALL